MKLYHNPLSSNGRRPRLVAHHIGVKLDEHVVDFAKGEHKSPEYLKLNPNGMVPTLVDEGFTIFEGRAAMQHIALKKPEAGLFPNDDRARVDIARWQFWDAAHFSPPLSDLVFEHLLKGMYGMGAPDQAKVDAAQKQWARFAAVLDGHLDGKQWLVGNALTIADFTVAASLTYAVPTQVPVSNYKNLSAWFDRVRELDAWKATEPKLG
jgi:glutathione S-transferase